MQTRKKRKPANWLTAFPEQQRPTNKSLRGRLRTVSKEQAKRLRHYKVVRDAYMLAHRGEQCPVAILCLGLKCKVSEVHHRRGRSGSLLCDTRFWMPVSPEGHRFIHDNPARARSYGWLAEREAREGAV